MAADELARFLARCARERAAAAERIAARHDGFARDERALAAVLRDIADRIERGERVPAAVLAAATTPLADISAGRFAGDDAAELRRALDHAGRGGAGEAA